MYIVHYATTRESRTFKNSHVPKSGLAIVNRPLFLQLNGSFYHRVRRRVLCIISMWFVCLVVPYWLWDAWTELRRGMQEPATLACVVCFVAGYRIPSPSSWRRRSHVCRMCPALNQAYASTALLRSQEGTLEDDRFDSAVMTADGNIVLSGFTNGAFDIAKPPWYSAAAVKLDTDGGVLWRYQVRCPTLSI